MAKEKKLPKVYVTKKLINDVEHSEIDFDLYGEFKFDYDTHSEFVTIPMGKQGDADGYPIKIDRMIKTLEKMKAKGATHVEMNYHCDHIGYEISGYEIKLAGSKEIEIFENERLTQRQKEAKISELYKQIQELQKQQ